ncbi:hypothetical protein [Coleofasciculus sp. G2-EDA-02]|uniref:hypothetical protein n=1 Tax=Coleofasciculus sp. G2-EDA-02 TaxID=3069529 RepID=UPI0033036947
MNYFSMFTPVVVWHTLFDELEWEPGNRRGAWRAPDSMVKIPPFYLCHANQLVIKLWRNMAALSTMNHCTGTAAIAFLWHHFLGNCISCHVGTRLGFGI